jgi:hypothetical protein
MFANVGLHLNIFGPILIGMCLNVVLCYTLKGILLPPFLFKTVCFLYILGYCIGHPGFTSSLRNGHYATALEMWNLILEKIFGLFSA